MTLTRKDVAATVFTILVTVVYAATLQGWGPLVGDSHRWATAVIVLLGMGACSQGRFESGRMTAGLGVLGALAAVFAVLALVTGALLPLSFLVADIVLLWALTTLRHAVHETPGRAAPA